MDEEEGPTSTTPPQSGATSVCGASGDGHGASRAVPGSVKGTSGQKLHNDIVVHGNGNAVGKGIYYIGGLL